MIENGIGEKIKSMDATFRDFKILKEQLIEAKLLERLNDLLKDKYSEYEIESFDDYVLYYMEIKEKINQRKMMNFKEYQIRTVVSGSVAGYADGFISKYKSRNDSKS